MTLTLDIPPDVEGALAQQARREGTTPERLVLDGLRRLFPSPPSDLATGEKPLSPTQTLFAAWAKEDQTSDPKEIVRRQQEGDELQAALRQSRLNLEGRTDFQTLLGEEPTEAAS